MLRPDGKPISHARVTATWWDGEPGPRSASHVVRRIQRPDGAVWLLRVAPEAEGDLLRVTR
jgi:hypothetical protein